MLQTFSAAIRVRLMLRVLPLGGYKDVIVAQAPEGHVELRADAVPHIGRQGCTDVSHSFMPNIVVLLCWHLCGCGSARCSCWVCLSRGCPYTWLSRSLHPQ